MDPAELRWVFQMFDRNGDGRITKQELSDSLENLRIYIPDADLVTMIDKIDVNGDGCIDIDKFSILYQTIMDERDEEDMWEAFNVFDQNGDGFITIEELRSILASLGLKQGQTVEDCRRMIRKVDVDGIKRVASFLDKKIHPLALRLVTEKVKEEEKEMGVGGLAERRNLMGWEKRDRPVPELGTGRSRDRRMMVPLRWASPRSLRLVRVSVPKSNSMASISQEKQRKKKERKKR